MNRRIYRTYSPVFAKGHIRDEIKLLINTYVNRYYGNCIDEYLPSPCSCIGSNKVSLYMNLVTYCELCDEMGCYMYDQRRNDYGRIFGYNIKIDNTLLPHVLLLREEDNMAREYCKNDVDSLDAFSYAIGHIDFGGRGAGKCARLCTPLPTKYIINDGAVILFWSDGDKTVVKRAKDDKNDPVKGFLWAYFIKHSKLSRTKANKYLRDLDKED